MQRSKIRMPAASTALTLYLALTMPIDDMTDEQKAKGLEMLQELHARRHPNHPDPEIAAAIEQYKARYPQKSWDETTDY